MKSIEALICVARSACVAAFALIALTALAADYPAPKESSAIIKNFRFNTGEVMPELRINYVTVGESTGEPVLILHGTTGSGTGMLNAGFAGELFGAAQALDATRYFVILPDAIGTGKSSKPSDGLRAAFPKYNYDDMVDAQYRLLTEHLGIKHLRVIVGNSMGGMQTWMWGTKYPAFMDALVPMASQPSEMSSRNWMLRRLIIDSIKNDPDWMRGNYTKQPKSLQFASVFFGIATLGGNQALYKAAPTRDKADAILNQRLAAPFVGDANDHLYQWDSSRDYNPSPGLERIQAAVLATNSADDERNPPETGIMDREIKRVKNGRVFLIPGSELTAGHGTTGQAKILEAAVGGFSAKRAEVGCGLTTVLPELVKGFFAHHVALTSSVRTIVGEFGYTNFYAINRSCSSRSRLAIDSMNALPSFICANAA